VMLRDLVLADKVVSSCPGAVFDDWRLTQKAFQHVPRRSTPSRSNTAKLETEPAGRGHRPYARVVSRWMSSRHPDWYGR
jgi:hypothetical protein